MSELLNKKMLKQYNYKTDSSTANSVQMKSKILKRKLKHLKLTESNMSSTLFSTHTYESLAYTTTTTSSSYKLKRSSIATTFTTPVNQRRCTPSIQMKKSDRFMLISNRNDCNQTIFEPKHSSTPFSKEQKTSTPNFNKTNESKFANQMTFQQSRLNTVKDVYYVTSSSTRYLNESYCDMPMISTRSNNTNKHVSTSTPKSSRIILNLKTVHNTKMENDKLNVDSSVLSTNNVSTVTTVIKCCIRPFKNLIKNNKNIKKLCK